MSKLCWKFFNLPVKYSVWVSQMTQCWRTHLPNRSCGLNPWVGKIPWSRKWQPTPVFFPGKSCGPGRLLAIGSTRIEHNLVTKPHKAHSHWEKKELNSIQNVQVDFAVFWILVNVMAERKEKLGVWARCEEQAWFSVRLLWVDPMRRWDLSQVLKKIWELEKFLGSRKIWP